MNAQIVKIVLFVLLVGFAFAALFAAWLWVDTKKEVQQIPRIPMDLCDIHGPYPADASLYIDLPGSETGKVKLCPYCMKNRLSAKKVK